MFIYVIVNDATLKLYVGQHKGDSLKKLKQYLQRKFSAAWHDEGGRSHLFASMRKYPKEVWSIHPLLSDLHTREECNHWETFYIRVLKSQHPDVGYNICRGGEGFTGSFSEESKRKMSEAHKAQWARMSEDERRDAIAKLRAWMHQISPEELQAFYDRRALAQTGVKRDAAFSEMRRRLQTGKKFYPETRVKMSASMKRAIQEGRVQLHQFTPEEQAKAHQAAAEKLRGVPRSPEVLAAWHSPEAQAKSAATRKGMHLSAKHVAGISKRQKLWWRKHRNHKFSADRNAKISAAMKGIPKSPETIAKMKAAKAGQRVDIGGKVSGRLTALRYIGQTRSGHALVLCRCSCDGKEISVLVGNFTSGHTTSCGCLKHQQFWKRRKAHRRKHAPKSRQHRNPAAVSSRRIHESRH